jgi:hypothetical protein
VKDERCEVLLRAVAESLPPLGRVDAGEADAVRAAIRIEEGERVAVGDGDDLSDELGADSRRRDRKNQYCKADKARCYTRSLLRPRLCPCASQRTSGQSGQVRLAKR